MLKPCDVPVGCSPVGGGSLLWKYLLLLNKMQDIFHFVGSASDLADSQKDAVESDRSWEMTRWGEELQLKIKRIIKIIMNNKNRRRAVTGWFLVCRLLSYWSSTELVDSTYHSHLAKLDEEELERIPRLSEAKVLPVLLVGAGGELLKHLLKFHPSLIWHRCHRINLLTNKSNIYQFSFEFGCC